MALRERAFFFEERPMTWTVSSVAILVAAVWSVAVGPQSGGTMAKGDKMDKRGMMDTNYVGCIEAGSAAGTFTLTHLATADHMGKDMMKDDDMKKNTMAKEKMSKDAMAPTTLTLTSSSVDLGKYLGHKVSVTGSRAHEKMDAMEKGTMGKGTSTFTVTSLKTVAATCS
jgi:pentapeptide MXKDX repeat protein